MDSIKLKGYLYLGITIMIFSTLEVVSSSLKGLIHPTQLIFIRFLIGGLALLPWVIAKKEKISKKDWLFFAGLGILNPVISMGSLQIAISLGKASTPTARNSTRHVSFLSKVHGSNLPRTSIM